MINIEEFCEVASSSWEGGKSKLDVEPDAKGYKSTPDRRELEKSKRDGSPPKRSNSINADKFEEDLEETVKKLQTPEKDQKEEPKKDEQISRKLRFEDEQQEEKDDGKVPEAHKFLKLLLKQLQMDKELESLKETLFSFEGFNLVDSFRLFDPNNDGYISEEGLS